MDLPRKRRGPERYSDRGIEIRIAHERGITQTRRRVARRRDHEAKMAQIATHIHQGDVDWLVHRMICGSLTPQDFADAAKKDCILNAESPRRVIAEAMETVISKLQERVARDMERVVADERSLGTFRAYLQHLS